MTKKIHKNKYVMMLQLMIRTLEQHYNFVAMMKNNATNNTINIDLENVDKIMYANIHARLCILKLDFIRSTSHIEKRDLVLQFHQIQDEYNNLMI